MVSNDKTISACIFGAGGASRAAVYALHHNLKCAPIYILNRDEYETEALMAQFPNYPLISVSEKLYLPEIQVFGTVVPNSPAVTHKEKFCIETALKIIFRDRGIFLDMCYNPRETLLLQAAKQNNWKAIEGIDVLVEVVTHQIALWTNKNVDLIDRQELRILLD